MMDLLVVGAHPDDAEIGLGGTLALMARRGWRTAILDLTNGEPTPRGTPETRAREAAAAAERLSCERKTLTLPNRYLFDSREAREEVASVFREWRPKVVALPWWSDAHPDHLAATAIAESARFYAKFTKTDMPGEPFYPPRVVYYFASHLRAVPGPDAVIDISETLEEKMAALACYESQFGEGDAREGFFGFISGAAGLWGSMIGRRAGEPIFAREPMGLDGLEGLI
jgi:N-acetylglucosamine malate deacetylase 1